MQATSTYKFKRKAKELLPKYGMRRQFGRIVPTYFDG
jgi:hypothetical protein